MNDDPQRLPADVLPGHESENMPPPEPSAEPKPEPTDKGPKHLEDRLSVVEKELKEERARRREAETDAREWYDRAQNRGRGRDEEAPAEPEPEIDLVEAISSGDKKQAARALKQLGFVAADEVEQLVERRVNSARGAVTNEAALLRDYPDLADDDSQFFAETSMAYKELAKKGHKGDDLLELAADRAAARLGVMRGGKRGKPSAPAAVEREGDDEGAEETERERITRVAAQSGIRSRPDRSNAGNDELSVEQKLIAKKFGISEEAYRKRATRGVSISGMNR